jgi:hypothetical protein
VDVERPDWETNWSALSPKEVSALFANHRGRWWIAGGWAIELFAGGNGRRHGDIDIELLRSEQLSLHETLVGWQIFACRYPGKDALSLWPAGEVLPPEVHDIWCRPSPDAPWGLQVMLMDDDGDSWRYRRNPAIGGALGSLGIEAQGMPVIAPEIQLLYKSKGRLPKDEFDLALALPLLDDARRNWLIDALEVSDPSNPWLAELRASPASTTP